MGSIDYIIDVDRNCACKDFNIPILTPDEAKEKDIKVLIAACRDLNIPLKAEYDLYKSKGTIIKDIYKELQDVGIEIKAGYDFYHMELMCNTKSLGFPREEVGL